MALTGLFAFAGSPTANSLDAEALAEFTQLKGTSARGAIEAVDWASRPVISVSVAIAVLLAATIARQHDSRVVAAWSVLVGANASTQILQIVGSEPRLHEILSRQEPTDAQWPSGQTTAAIALALVVILVAPPAWRAALAAAGSTYAVAVGVAVISLGRHFPSDVAAAFMVACAWGLASAPTSAFATPHGPLKRRLMQVASSSALAIAAATLLASWLTFDRLGLAWDYVSLHKHFAAGLLIATFLAIVTTATAVVTSEAVSD